MSRLLKPAAYSPNMAPTPPSHVDLWQDRALIVSALGKVSPHRHAAAALLIGLDGSFGLKWDSHGFVKAKTAYVATGVNHALECGDTLMATLYLFPMTGADVAMTQRLGIPNQGVSLNFGLGAEQVDGLVAIHGGDTTQAEARCRLDSLIGPVSPQPGDFRLKRVADMLRAGAVDGISADEVAFSLGISESRLMHLFKSGAGVTLRRYRLWERMRLVALHVGEGESLTMAGLAAGFADSSHLSHGFRSMFGLPASRVLNPGARIRTQH